MKTFLFHFFYYLFFKWVSQEFFILFIFFTANRPRTFLLTFYSQSLGGSAVHKIMQVQVKNFS